MTETFRVNPETGLLEAVDYLSSPHQDARPQNTQIELVVLHGISLPPGEFGSNAVPAFFCAALDMSSHPAFADIAALRVSAHLFIRRDGEVLQFVPFTQRAWHAGVSIFQDKTQCNDFSIGIELEGTDEIPYEEIQYQQLSKVLRALIQVYPAITLDRIVGHSDIAPGRKTDPGAAFDWEYLRGKLA
jgi:AmpD protein